MLWIVLITYGVIGCSDRRFVTFPAGVVHQREYIYYLHFGGEGSYILTCLYSSVGHFVYPII